MKLTIDPFPAMKKAAIDNTNAHFNAVALGNLHRDQAHAQKRDWVASGQLDKLEAEAKLRGMTAADFAKLIAGKADAAADRELQRQAILLRIEAAKTPEQLDAAAQIS